jgi:hypothetical protein
MQFPQRGTGIDTQFLREPGAHPSVVGQRVGLATGAIQGEQVLAGESFVPGTGGHLGGQLGHQDPGVVLA